MSDMFIPWSLAGLAAIWFGTVARRAGRNWLLWAIAGGITGLVICTFILGLEHATFIPYSVKDQSGFRFKVLALSVAVMLLVGLVLTIPLRRDMRDGSGQNPV
jgi:hypothetical protein